MDFLFLLRLSQAIPLPLSMRGMRVTLPLSSYENPAAPASIEGVLYWPIMVSQVLRHLERYINQGKRPRI